MYVLLPAFREKVADLFVVICYKASDLSEATVCLENLLPTAC